MIHIKISPLQSKKVAAKVICCREHHNVNVVKAKKKIIDKQFNTAMSGSLSLKEILKLSNDTSYQVSFQKFTTFDRCMCPLYEHLRGLFFSQIVVF